MSMLTAKWNKITLLLPIIIELIYFCSPLTTTPPLLMAILAFPALLILPGTMLIAITKRNTENKITEVFVEGFFTSTLIATAFTSIMLATSIPLTPLAYASTALILTTILAMIGLTKKTEIKPNKNEIALITLAISIHIILLLIFSKIPRLFTPDETSYISSARMCITNGTAPPMGVRPNENEITALLKGRYLWIYLITAFLGSTSLPAYQAGLLGTSFLIMTALASSLIVKSKWQKIIVFAIATANPLLFIFSSLTLNDLAISFFTTFAAVFFIKSFANNNNNTSINIKNLFYTLIGMVVVTLIKPNLMLFAAMWIILIYILLKYKLYKQNRKNKILLIVALIPLLLYEMCIDIPYVVSVWVLRSNELAVLFGKFLLISPAEKFVGWFVVPWWNPSAATLFTRSFTDYLDYFYRILMPESSSLIISALIIALPFLIFFKEQRKEIDKLILSSLILLSLYLNYLEMLSSASLSDASRWSLWMTPLWIPISVIILKDITEKPSFKKILPIFMSALILLWINIWLSRETGGVYVGYGLSSRSWTADTLIIQLILLIAILSLPFLKNDLPTLRFYVAKRFSAVKAINLKRVILGGLIILMLVNGLWYSTKFLEKSSLYEDHGFLAINDAFDSYAGDGTLTFANNYIYMRPYISDKLFQEGLLLPPPDTNEEFLKLLEIAPNNTLFLISNDSTITWYEYANRYIKSYVNNEIITPEKPNLSKLPRVNLTEPILIMTFDNANETIIMDDSGFGNNGENHGAKPTEGYYSKALQFDGQEYVSIPNNDILNVIKGITISFLAKIEKAEPQKGYMILSKGYAPKNGSYDVFIWDNKIYFELGNVGWLSFPAEPYIGTWHHFIFTYNGEKMQVYIDGSLVASKLASGFIRESTYDIEIGRDSERKYYYFEGLLDELSISNKTLSVTEIKKIYYTQYALQICRLQLTKGQAEFFRIVNDINVKHDIIVKSAGVNVNENRSVTVELQIESLNQTIITVLIATDRFTKVYTEPLVVGTNNVKFQFDYIVDPSWYEAGGLYWLHLAQTRVIIIEDDSIVYNKFTTTQNLYLMNIFLLTLLTGILAAYLIPQPKYH